MQKLLSLFLIVGLLGCEVEQDQKGLIEDNGGNDGTEAKGTLFESTGKTNFKKNDILGLWESEIIFGKQTSEMIRLRFSRMSIVMARACRYNNGYDLFVQTASKASYDNKEITIEEDVEKSVSGKQFGQEYECSVGIERQKIPYKIYDGKFYIDNIMYTKISD